MSGRCLIHSPSPSPFGYIRSFCTSRASFKIAPESPKFVDIPRPPRIKPTWKPYVKGQLPKPKAIFRKVGPNQAEPERLALATAEPKKQKDIPKNQPEVQAFISWKARMADLRRKNLREGLTELHQKKVEFERKREEISAARNAEREQLITKKMREDVRLTLPSVLSTIRNSGGISDPNPEERLQAKKRLWQAKQRLKKEEQMEKIHELYLHASNFIVTDAQLDKAIDEVFNEDFKDPIKTFPMTVSELLVKRSADFDPTAITGLNRTASELKMEVAAALTGGKLANETIDRMKTDIV